MGHGFQMFPDVSRCFQMFPDVSEVWLFWGRSARRAAMTLACWPGRWAWRPRSIPRAVIWFWSPTTWPSKQAPLVSRRTGVHMDMSENGVYPQWNSYLVGIMIINHWVQGYTIFRQTHIWKLHWFYGWAACAVGICCPGNHYSTDLCIAERVVVLHWIEQWSFGFSSW